MKDRKYLFFVFFAIISFLLLTYSSIFSLKIDDLGDRVFYAVQENRFDPSSLVIVEIDQDSLIKTDSKWPFKRIFYAQLLRKLQKYQPKVIGFDIVFAGKSAIEADDQDFSLALEHFKPAVVLAGFLGQEGNPTFPPKEFKRNASFGFVNVPFSRDGVIRYTRGYFESKNFSDFSWAVKIASHFYGITPKKEKNRLLIGDTQIPINSEGVFPINYLLKPKDFKTISFHKLLFEDFNLEFFSEKIVLIGSVLDITHDIHPTPLGKMPGIYIHANAIFNILNQKLIKDFPIGINFVVLFITLALISCIFSRYTFLRRVFLSLGVLLLMFWINLMLRFVGFQFASGKIIISCLAFIVMGSGYTYLNYLFSVIKIKNRAVCDPLTGFYNLRYFFEHLIYDMRKISKPKFQIAIIQLNDLQTAITKLDFFEIKTFWKRVNRLLFSHSKLWSNYSNEIIIGKISNLEEAKSIKEELENFLSENKIKTYLKIGIISASQKILQKNAMTYVIDRLNSAKDDLIPFDEKKINIPDYKKQQSSDFLSSLYADTEEKNQWLLLTIEKLKKEKEKVKKAYLQLITSLIAALESKDPYTRGHTERVCKYSLLLADKINLSENEKENIKKAALLHDLGKIGISDFVLHKKGKLSETEFEIVKEHSTTSAKILESIDEFKEIIPYILYHHENFDGTGYPHGLAGDFIPLGAKIIAIADVFDALITGRDYKKAFSPQKTVEILKDMKNKKLDPKLVDKFIEVLKSLQIIN